MVVLDILNSRVVEASPRQDTQGQGRCGEVQLAISEAKVTAASQLESFLNDFKGISQLLTLCQDTPGSPFRRISGASQARSSAARRRAATAPG